MENYLDRISKIAEIEGITINKLETIIGASKNVLQRPIKNKTDIQTKWLVKIGEKFPHYNLDWILLGRGEMYIENIPKIEVTDSNKYLVDKLIESTKELKDKDVRIKELEDKIIQLEREKKNLSAMMLQQSHRLN